MADEPTPRLPDPSRPRRPQQLGRSSQQANSATFAALFGLGLVTFGLLGMVAMVLPQVAGLVFVFAGAVGFFALHYVVWGWWLPRMMRQDEDAES